MVVKREQADPERSAAGRSEATHSDSRVDATSVAEEGRRAQRDAQESLLGNKPIQTAVKLNCTECKYKFFVCCVLKQRKPLDSDCITKMAIHYDVSIDYMHQTVSEWAYDYTTATYLLLQQKKQKGRPIRLFHPHRSVPASPAPVRRARLLSSDDDDVIRDEEALIESAKYCVNTRMSNTGFDSPFADFAKRTGLQGTTLLKLVMKR